MSKSLNTSGILSFQVCHTTSIRLPSTPDADYLAELTSGTPEQEDMRTLHQYFKQQQTQHLRQPLQNPFVAATLAIDISKSSSVPSMHSQSFEPKKICNIACKLSDTKDAALRVISTPESSQTDSDDVSPQIQRKRRTGHQKDFIPRFSISIEDEHSG